MPDDIDIGKVIQSGSRQMDLGDLAKLGHKKVRVIDERRINELISQAVQNAIEREGADSAGRLRREAAEKAKAELEAQLAEHQARLDVESLASKEVEKLRVEVAGLQGQLKESTAVIETEKQRIAADSQKEFQRLLKSTQQGLEEKKGAYEKALRGMLERADQSIPKEELADLPVVAVGEEVQAAHMLEALNRRVEKLGTLLGTAKAEVAGRDQDIAMAAAEHHRQKNEIERLKKEGENLRLDLRDKERQFDGREQDLAVAAGERRKQKEVVERLGKQLDEMRDELRDKERQFDAREQDVTMAALEQRRLRDETKHLREEAGKVAELSGEVRRMTSERELLMARIEEYRDRERTASDQVTDMAGKLAEVQTGGTQSSGELMEAISGMKGSLTEEIARQISWALSAQKTGATGIDPGLQLEALFSQEIETNIESVKIEERTGKTLTDKLAKLREARNQGLGQS